MGNYIEDCASDAGVSQRIIAYFIGGPMDCTKTSMERYHQAFLFPADSRPHSRYPRYSTHRYGGAQKVYGPGVNDNTWIYFYQGEE